MSVCLNLNGAYRPLVAIALTAMLVSCSPSATSTSADTPATTASAETPAAVSSAPPGAESPAPLSQLPKLQGKATVVLTVKGKPITLELDGDHAPVTAGNFVDLVKRGVYDGTAFHRVEPGFVVQGGDPNTKDPKADPQSFGQGGFVDPKTGQPREIPLEILPEKATEPVYGKTLKSAGVTQPPQLKHERGALAMARSMLPDSASSQFYFALSTEATAPLDGDYAVFGKVTQGMDVVDGIQIGDRIDSAKVTQGLENLKE
ncbi:MAG: peptidylprolyl isomerase [Thermosynechococcaceae cyanobacterium]